MATIIGEVDSLGYTYCIRCHPEAVNASVDCYPVAIWSDADDGTDLCDSCHEPINLGAKTSKPSANGFALDVNGSEIVATWPAPYFVLVLPDGEDDEPLLIHCDDLYHAARTLRHGGILLDASFVQTTLEQAQAIRDAA